MTNTKRQTPETEEEAVLRLLRGEDMEALSRETGFVPDELAQWLENYMKAGRKALETLVGDPRGTEHPDVTKPTWSPWNQQGTWLPD